MSRSIERIRVHCTCSNAYQDSRYGKGVRVANPVDKSRKGGSGRITQAVCTVCGAIHGFAGQEVVAGANTGKG